jgi:hypothetical protein
MLATYLPPPHPVTGTNAKCPCGAKNQHSLSQAGRCSAMRKGKLAEWEVNVGKKI